MRCIYSIGACLGGVGVGTTGYHSAKGIHDHGRLERVLCAYHDQVEIPEDVVFDVLPGGGITDKLLMRSAMLFGSPNGYAFKGGVYDRLASRKIVDCDVFHGWSLQSLHSMRSARERGALAVLERPNSHILTQKRILDEEFRRWDVKGRHVEDAEVSRGLIEYEEADVISVPSEFVRQSFIEEGVSKSKVHVTPYGYDSDVFSPGEKADDTFRVLFAGHISCRKGVPYLLEAWERLGLEDAELVLVGKVFPEMREMLGEYTGRFDNITVKGMVPSSQMVAEYRKASVFALPTLEEGFALVLFEALACGLPVITTPNSGGADIIDDGSGGFIVPVRDAESLADRIKYLHENPDEAGSIGSSAVECVRDYTWKRYGERLIGLYERVLA
ncbi:MAG: glycosyltransferase [Candidatus Altiarchaeales archaeon]|nr:glycosyltransferase [Candidatus Altiarchaeales archaeon]MBD3415518.1 glycosyltransferase [Candidatus Altiarchaeales archaeon]